MKTPISYYGGKQRLITEILPLFPNHTQYVEPFIGGGAVFFAKSPSEAEVINDLDGRIVNFYRVLKTHELFIKLQERVKATLHNELEYRQTRKILEAPMVDSVEYAWAFWMQTNMSFSFILCGSFAFGNDDRCAKLSNNKRNAFNENYLKRIEKSEIFCRDAVDLIKLKDTEDTFFYLDPPYVSSDCGHYDGYTMEHFKTLLDTVSEIKGKFLMSSYPETILMEYREKFQWNFQDIIKQVGVTGKREETKYKTECLTWNYKLTENQLSLF